MILDLMIQKINQPDKSWILRLYNFHEIWMQKGYTFQKGGYIVTSMFIKKKKNLLKLWIHKSSMVNTWLATVNKSRYASCHGFL